MKHRIIKIILNMMVVISFAYSAMAENCTTMNPDLSFSIPCASYGKAEFEFSMVPVKATSGEYASGLFWQVNAFESHDQPTELENRLQLNSDLSFILPCVDYGGNQFQFTLVPAGEASELTWAMDPESLTVAEEGFVVTIMHMNDTHSYIEGVSGEKVSINGISTYVDMGGYARMATKIAAVRNATDNTLLVHAGDNVQGTLYFTRYEGQADFAFLNALGVDVMCVGNHEFDKGPAYMEKFISYADFPIVSANINDSSDVYLADKIPPYTIKTLAGKRVAILGIITPDTASTSSPGDDIVFTNTVATVETYVAELKGMGINKIIVLSHQGYEADMALASRVAGVDIIIGGHSHTLLGGADFEALGISPTGAYPTAVKNPAGGETYVVQAWKHTLAMGVLNVTFSENGVVSKIGGTPLILIGKDNIRQKDVQGNKVVVEDAVRADILRAVTANPAIEVVEQDPAILTMLAPYKTGIQEMQSQVIAKVSSPLYHVRIPSTDSWEGVPLPNGSYIAPVVCNAMIWKMKQVGLDINFAIQNAGSMKKSIQEGDLTVGDAYELMPYGNTLVVLDMTGSEFKKAIGEGVAAATWGMSSGAFPYVAGCRYTVDARTNPEIPVLTSVEKQDGSGNWVEIDNTTTYKIVTNGYIASGGDYYDSLKNASGYRNDTGFVDAEVFMDYAIAMGTLNRPDTTGVTYITGEAGGTPHAAPKPFH